MLFRPFFNEQGSCASYLLGCLSQRRLAVVDPHLDLVDSYLGLADELGAPIVAGFETHLHADHLSGLRLLVEKTGATAYVPAGAGMTYPHHALVDGDCVELGNTVLTARATPGHAPAHLAYLVADRRRGSDEPWLVLSGDSLLIGDVGRPDLHLPGDLERQAHVLYESLARLMELPDYVVLCPAHYAGSVCGRGLSGNPISTIGFERTHNRMLAADGVEAFATLLLRDIPPRPADQDRIVASNRVGRIASTASATGH